MKPNFLVIVFLIIFILAASPVHSLSISSGSGCSGCDMFVWVKGNTGLESLDDPKTDLTAYALNYPTAYQNYTNTSYIGCSFGASDFDPLVLDYDGDGYGDILTGTDYNFYLFNRDCGYMTAFDTSPYLTYSGGIMGAPVIDNPDRDSRIDLIIGNVKNISRWEYDPDLGGFTIQDITGSPSITSANYVSPFLSDQVFGFVYGTGGITTLAHFVTSNFSYVGYTSDTTINGQAQYPRRKLTLHYARFYNVGGSFTYRIPTMVVSNTAHVVLFLWNGETGAQITNADIATIQAGAIKNYDTFIAKLSTANVVFASWKAGTNIYWGNGIYDLNNLNTLYVQKNYSWANTTENHNSNWVVGDLDQDGENEACYLWCDPVYPFSDICDETYFTCLETALGEPFTYDVTGKINVNNLAMGDFDNTNDYSEIVTCEGIFEWTGATFNKIYDTGISGSCSGDVEVFLDGFSGVPAFLYSDQTQGYFWRASDVGSLCGNGICGAYENPYNCYEDCNENTTSGREDVGTYVEDEADCISGYAVNGRCELRPGGYPCSTDSLCLSDSCNNGICDNPNWIQSLTAAKDRAGAPDLGSSTLLSLVISLFLGIIFGVAIISFSKDAAMIAAGGAGVVFVLAFSFFGIIGWVHSFVVIGLWFLLAFIGAVIYFMGKGG